jgi:hypothetical protein
MGFLLKRENQNMEILKLDDFEVMFFDSIPPRVEAKIEFSRTHISQKLIFALMDISYSFGIGCSCPNFYDSEDDDTVFFLLGMIINSKKHMKNQLKNMNKCLLEILNFAKDLNEQMDFSKVDLSMFDSLLIADVEKLSVIRDQRYNESWDVFYEMMIVEGYEDAAQIILKLKKFEEVNNKDIGFVGAKLNYFLLNLYPEQQKNTVFN